MSEIDEPMSPILSDLIAAERETDAPPAAVIDHGWTRLDAALHTPVPPTDPGADPSAAAGTATTATATATATATKVALVAAGLGAALAGAIALSSGDPEPEPQPEAVAVSEIETASAPAADLPSSESEPESEPEPEPEPEPADESETGATRHETARRSHVAPTQPQDSLAAEIALIEATQRALAQGQAREALRLVRHHARRFPSGVMKQERRAAEVLALCALQRPDARAAAGRFLSEYPRSTFVDRIRTACPKP